MSERSARRRVGRGSFGAAEPADLDYAAGERRVGKGLDRKRTCWARQSVPSITA
jgi:hypothetical protein